MLSILLDAALRHQVPSPTSISHPDPAHLNAQFLSASSIGPLEVHVKTFTQTKRWTRLDVSLQQPNPKAHEKGSPEMLIRIRAHVIFTKLPALPLVPIAPSPTSMWVLPNTPSSQARLCPFVQHPAELKENHIPSVFSFKKHMKWMSGVEISGGREGEVDSDGKRKLEWGSWFELKEEEVDVRQMAACEFSFLSCLSDHPT